MRPLKREAELTDFKFNALELFRWLPWGKFYAN